MIAGSIIASTTFTGTLVVDTSWTQKKTVGSSTVTETFSELLRQSHTTGTAANQMSGVVVIDGSLTNSASATHNVSGGITNSFGDTITFTEIRFFAFYSDDTDNDTIELGDAATSEFSSWLGGTNQTVKVAGGGLLMWTAPTTGFSSTNGNLKVTNTGTNTVTYQVYFGGIE